jgi:hypothetical protein
MCRRAAARTCSGTGGPPICTPSAPHAYLAEPVMIRTGRAAIPGRQGDEDHPTPRCRTQAPSPTSSISYLSGSLWLCNWSMDLTPDQAVTLRDAVRSRMAYFAVQVRMYQRGVGTGDRLYDLFHAAELAMRAVAAELHSRSLDRERRPCEPGGAGGGRGGSRASLTGPRRKKKRSLGRPGRGRSNVGRRWTAGRVRRVSDRRPLPVQASAGPESGHQFRSIFDPRPPGG